MKLEGTKTKGIRIEFDNFTELLDYVEADKNPNSYARTYSRRSDFCEWTWQESIDMMNVGWKEGVNKIEDLSAKLNRELETYDEYTYNIENDVVGDYIDMGLYMAGEPECFGRIDLLPTPKESINVMISAAFSCSVSQETIYNRGAVLTNLVERLRKRYHVNVQIVNTVENLPGRPGKSDLKYLDIIINMDTSNEYSRDLMAFYAANSAFLRRILFRVMERVQDTDRCGFSYGIPRNTVHDEKTLYFHSIHGNDPEWENIESSAKYLKSILKEYDMA